MAGKRRGTNIFCKENENVKKVKKASNDKKVVVNVHRLICIVIRGMTDGQVVGPSPRVMEVEDPNQNDVEQDFHDINEYDEETKYYICNEV